MSIVNKKKKSDGNTRPKPNEEAFDFCGAPRRCGPERPCKHSKPQEKMVELLPRAFEHISWSEKYDHGFWKTIHEMPWIADGK